MMLLRNKDTVAIYPCRRRQKCLGETIEKPDIQVFQNHVQSRKEGKYRWREERQVEEAPRVDQNLFYMPPSARQPKVRAANRLGISNRCRQSSEEWRSQDIYAEVRKKEKE